MYIAESTWPAVGMVDRQCTICDGCGPCQTIPCILKPGFSPISMNSLRLRVTQMPICPDLAIITDIQTDHFTTYACTRGNKSTFQHEPL